MAHKLIIHFVALSPHLIKSNQINIYSQHIQNIHIINMHNIIHGAYVYVARCQLAISDRLPLTPYIISSNTVRWEAPGKQLISQYLVGSANNICIFNMVIWTTIKTDMSCYIHI